MQLYHELNSGQAKVIQLYLEPNFGQAKEVTIYYFNHLQQQCAKEEPPNDTPNRQPPSNPKQQIE